LIWRIGGGRGEKGREKKGPPYFDEKAGKEWKPKFCLLNLAGFGGGGGEGGGKQIFEKLTGKLQSGGRGGSFSKKEKGRGGPGGTVDRKGEWGL